MSWVRGGVLLACMVLALPSATAWDQPRGGADRNQLSAIVPGPLDVLANITLIDDGRVNSLRGQAAIETPHGLIWFTSGSDGCAFARLRDIRLAQIERTEISPCAPWTFLQGQGYAATDDLVIGCFVSGEKAYASLRAFHAGTLLPAWEFVPDQAWPLAHDGWWSCAGSAIDDETGEIVVPFTFNSETMVVGNVPSGHRIASFDLASGNLRWDATVPVEAPGAAFFDPTLLTPAAPGNALIPGAVTLTEGGVMVLGIEICGQCSLENGNVVGGFAAWFDREGSYRGFQSASTGSGPQGASESRSPPASRWAVAQGPVVATALGGRLLVVNPEVGSPLADVPLQAVENTFIFNIWPAPTWLEQTIVVPLPHSISAFDASQYTPIWAWSEGLEWTVVDTIPTTTGEIVVIVAPAAPPGTEVEARLVRLDAKTGAVLSKMPLPRATTTQDGLWYAEASPVATGEIIVTSSTGSALILGSSPEALRPAVELSNPYPGPGEPVTLSAKSPGEITGFEVNWGDGTIEPMATGASLSHAFATRGIRDVEVRALRADGTTAARVIPIDVGGTPPPELTTLQKAFSPEYQNWTFFLLGTLITIVGLAFTVGRHRRRFSRLEAELAAVEEIRLLSTTDPHGAVQALKAYRERLPSDLARRRIDDSQYQVLDIRSARLLKVLRTRMFAPYDTRLSMRYHRLLDAAFEDAILQPSEAAALVAALEQEEAIRPEDRAEIQRLLAEFTSHNVGAALRG